MSNRLVHLDFEDFSEQLLRQQSNVLKNQLGHSKPLTRGFGTQNNQLGASGSLWYKIAGVATLGCSRPMRDEHRMTSTNEITKH